MSRRRRNKGSRYFILLIVAVLIGAFLGVAMEKQRARTSIFIGTGKNKINTILDVIRRHYVEEIDMAELEDVAIPEILRQLDPHTSYIPVEYMQEVTEKMSGNFSGIGIQFNIQSDTVLVVDVISGAPSHLLGILAGDRIVSVDDTLIAGVGITNKKVMDKLRGEKGTHVRVEILRRGYPELIDFDIIRGDIPLYSVDVSYMINDFTGYIKVSRFAEKTYEEFTEALEGLDEHGVESIIVDLRGNPGGYLLAVIQMVREFLGKGEMIVYTEGRSHPHRIYNAMKDGKYLDKSVIVLIDEFSASASEIMAGALQDNDRGTIIGNRSFGKGLVQEQISFQDGSSMRLTVARYHTPSGRCIQKPYDNGVDKYYEDIMSRHISEEAERGDSIQLSDSLTYFTRNGRAVYGGGGIMPDIVVKRDSEWRSDYFVSVVRKGLTYRFALMYADREREKLKKFKSAKEFTAYLEKANVFDEFIKYAEEEHVPYDREGVEVCAEILKARIMAYIARNIIGEEGFYPIIGSIDEILQRAILEADNRETSLK